MPWARGRAVGAGAPTPLLPAQTVGEAGVGMLAVVVHVPQADGLAAPPVAVLGVGAVGHTPHTDAVAL